MLIQVIEQFIFLPCWAEGLWLDLVSFRAFPQATKQKAYFDDPSPRKTLIIMTRTVGP